MTTKKQQRLDGRMEKKLEELFRQRQRALDEIKGYEKEVSDINEFIRTTLVKMGVDNIETVGWKVKVTAVQRRILNWERLLGLGVTQKTLEKGSTVTSYDQLRVTEKGEGV